jgi:hypothetical protein
MFPKEPKPTTPVTFSGSISTEAYAGKRTMLPMVPIILRANNKEIRLYALLDNGSEISVMKRRVSDLLKMEGRNERVITNTVDGRSKPVDTLIVNFNIASLDGRFTFNIVDAQVRETFRLSKRSLDLAALAKKWPHLAHVPIHSVLEEDVAILIGQDHPAAIEIFETQKDPFDQHAPRAYMTAFGWCIGGSTGRNDQSEYSSFHASLAEDKCDLLLEQFIDFDSFGTKPNVAKPVSKEEERAWGILKTTTKHNGVRYESGLLWKTDNPKLPNNFFAAQRRFLNLERKFAKNEGLAVVYKNVIDTYINYGHARKLTKKEIDDGPPGRTWYNPHHPVFNPNKTGKCRVVFDLSAKYHGVCLNDALLKGPDLIFNLIGILLRFRQYAHPVVADVEKMFHQVLVSPSDGPAFRFLWREPGTIHPPDVYQMVVHLFGAVSSPSVCLNALQQAAKDSDDPEGLLHQITRHFYMDNWFVSFSTTTEAISTANRLTDALKRGGFPLTQWATSSQIIRESLPAQQQDAKPINMDLDAEPIERTFGLVWYFGRDVFILEAAAKSEGKSKRQLLRSIFSIFDPLGFLSPIVFQAKYLMQDIWRLKFDWDDELSQDLIDRWIN